MASLVKNYNKCTRAGQYHFGVVIKYLKTLRNSDLNDLKKLCLDEELERLQSLIGYVEERLKDAQINLQHQLQQYKIKPEAYKPGDFSFLSEPLTIRILTNAYKAVEKLNAWSFFDNDPPENKGYMHWNHPMVDAIGNELGSDGHTGASMGFTMRWMQRIRKVGWNAALLESKENYSNELGSLNKARL